MHLICKACPNGCALFTLAQRFAWLSEWLRRNDVEMIEFECFFMNLLRRRIDDASVPLP
jgi:hypothetical protein